MEYTVFTKRLLILLYEFYRLYNYFQLAPVVIKGIEQGPSTTTVKSEDMPISEQILEIDKKLTELSQSLPHDPVTIARKQAQARYEEEKNHDEIEEEIEQKCIYNGESHFCFHF